MNGGGGCSGGQKGQKFLAQIERLLVHVKATTCMLPRMQADPALADEAVNMEEGEGFRQGSEGSGEEDSQDNTQSAGPVKRPPRAAPVRSGSRVGAPAAPDMLHAGSCAASDHPLHACLLFKDSLGSLARLIKTLSVAVNKKLRQVGSHFDASCMLQGQEGRSLRSPEVLTPSQKLREAEEDEAAAEDTPHHTSWGGRGRRGASGPSGLYSPDMSSKRKRAQVQPSHHSPCRPPSSKSPLMKCTFSVLSLSEDLDNF